MRTGRLNKWKVEGQKVHGEKGIATLANIYAIAIHANIYAFAMHVMEILLEQQSGSDGNVLHQLE